ncbi:YihY/virulence factor BrkB family protein [Robbsia sp. KACC 23696]|uniref:YihY/virulence factor BrkB family protein n=1 Tax=Robbsia sp. KACC 23696 TaxID=3149231 RepID=UPI00325C1C25
MSNPLSKRGALPRDDVLLAAETRSLGPSANLAKPAQADAEGSMASPVLRKCALISEPVKWWFQHRCASLSASIAFYSAFSLAPTLVLIIAIVSFFYGAEAAQGRLVAEIQDYVGDQAAAGIQAMISSAWNARVVAGTTLVSMVVVAVGASATFASLNTALNDICPPLAATGRGARATITKLIRARLISFALVIGAGFLIVFMLVLDTVVKVAERWMIGDASHAVLWADIIQRVLSFVILLGAFTAVLKLVPDALLEWRCASYGGFTSAVLFSAGKNVFSFYLAHAGTANSFGAAGSFAVVLMWLFYSAAVFLLGAEVMAAAARRRGLLAPLSDLKTAGR